MKTIVYMIQIYFQLKSHDSDSFAALLEPDGRYRTDEELYKAVHANGGAVICPYVGWSFEPGKVVRLSPAEFERNWKGD